MSQKQPDPAMAKVRQIWTSKNANGMTQQMLGELMGYKTASARKSVSQFLQSNDCQVGMLRKFAKAVGVKIESLVKEP